MKAVDLFAGPGGWDEGIRELDIHPLGIEWDEAACATREAAGHQTLRADVAELDPSDFAPCDLLIASPPCPAFSNAGKRRGLRDLPLIFACAQALVAGRDTRDEIRERLEDQTALLVVEPLRWALALRPTFIACEQVPPVLKFWEWCARALDDLGYSAWAGTLSSEQYGVPQTRERAYLMARRDGPTIQPPKPTHRKYIARRRLPDGETLFDLPAQPITRAGDEHLKPWVSMAEALGWGMDERPYPVIASSRKSGGPDKEKVGGSAARDLIYRERERGAWVSPAEQTEEPQ